MVSRLCYRGAACVARQWCPHQGDRPASLANPTGTRRGDGVITDVIMTLFSRRVSSGQKRQPNNTFGAAAVHPMTNCRPNDGRTKEYRKKVDLHFMHDSRTWRQRTPPSTSLLYYPSEIWNRKGTGHTRKNTENTRWKHHHRNFNMII